MIPPLTPYRYLENHSECYFLKLKKLKHSWNPRTLPLRPLSLKKGGGGGWVFEIFEKKREGSSDVYSHKNWRVSKVGGFVLKKEVSLIFILINSSQCYLSLSVWCVRVLFIYTISIRIICVSQEEPSLIVSNQQIYHFYK